MKPNKFRLDKDHTQLTALARCVHIYGDSSKAGKLAALEKGKSEFAVRWAYCCAGISTERIDALLARKAKMAPV